MSSKSLSPSTLILGICFLCADPAYAQHLVPLQDSVQEPLLPPGISNHDADVSGSLLYIWSEEGPTQAIQYIGDFRFRLGSSLLKSREALIWMTTQEYEGRPYLYFEVFLWQDAGIIGPGGATSSGPVLFATLATFGKLKLAADKKAFESNAQSNLYEDALSVRQAVSPLLLGEPLVEERPSPLTTVAFPRAKARTRVRDYRSKQISSQNVDGELIASAIGDFYFSQTYVGEQEYMEARADAAVFFLPEAEESTDDTRRDQTETVGPSFDLEQVKGVYLEGDVVLTSNDGMIRADKLYYDLENDRALILDPVLRVNIRGRSLPIYVRANEARRLSSAEFTATRARVSTSEFYTPHYHIGAERLYFATETATSELEGIAGARSGQYSMVHTSFGLGGWPVLYWPFAAGNFREGESAIRDLRVGNDDNFGYSLETRWDLFNFFGLQKPGGFKEATLDIDYYSERGLGVGVNTEYEFDKSYGEFRGYFIYDQEDRDNLGPRRDDRIEHPNRGRATWRHRHFLPDDWELTLEGSYISDPNFLEEYFESEFDEDKDQETYLRLKKQRDNWAFDVVTQVRILNWLTQTERFPEVSFRLIGEPLGPTTFFSENRAGIVRYRPDERRIFISARNNVIDNKVRSGAVARADTRQELDWPVAVGPLNLVPFVVARGSWWDDSPWGGSLGRSFGIVGLRGSSYLSRVFEDVQSGLWDINGIRHIIKFDFTVWASAGDRASRDLFPFDEGVEGIDDFSGGTVGVRQRWQTQRGGPEHTRIVDWITLDLEAGYFSNPPGDDITSGYASYSRPEESISSNYLSADASWRVGDTTVLLADANYDVDQGDLDIADVTLAVERTPRFSYFLGWRMINETDSNLFGFGCNYRLSEKHTMALRHYSDIDRGSTEMLDLTYIRKFPRWYVSFTFALDEIEDNVSISMAIWPEGYPRVALGSKRYTGLSTSTAIRPGK